MSIYTLHISIYIHKHNLLSLLQLIYPSSPSIPLKFKQKCAMMLEHLMFLYISCNIDIEEEINILLPLTEVTREKHNTVGRGFLYCPIYLLVLIPHSLFSLTLRTAEAFYWECVMGFYLSERNHDRNVKLCHYCKKKKKSTELWDLTFYSMTTITWPSFLI